MATNKLFAIEYRSGVCSCVSAETPEAALRAECNAAGAECADFEETWSGGDWDVVVRADGLPSAYYKLGK